jgi:hypothetical protein
VKRGDEWGEFDRNGQWLGVGELRCADPTFCRWVTGEYLYNERLLASGTELFLTTRLGTERAQAARKAK